MSEEIQRKLQSELDSFKNVDKEFRKAVQTRQQLDTQLNENKDVKKELDLVTGDAKVFKAVGPILVKSELVEAKQNVNKRIDYISKEIKKVDDLIITLEKKKDAHGEALQKLQHQFQQAHVKAAMHA